MIRLCLREMAQDRGIVQAQLARKCALSPVTVHNYWNNKVRNISLDVLDRLGEGLGISGTNLLTNLPLPQDNKESISIENKKPKRGFLKASPKLVVHLLVREGAKEAGMAKE